MNITTDWDMKKNELHYYIDLLRMNETKRRGSDVCVRVLHNVIIIYNIDIEKCLSVLN